MKSDEFDVSQKELILKRKDELYCFIKSVAPDILKYEMVMLGPILHDFIHDKIYTSDDYNLPITIFLLNGQRPVLLKSFKRRFNHTTGFVEMSDEWLKEGVYTLFPANSGQLFKVYKKNFHKLKPMSIEICLTTFKTRRELMNSVEVSPFKLISYEPYLNVFSTTYKAYQDLTEKKTSSNGATNFNVVQYLKEIGWNTTAIRKEWPKTIRKKTPVVITDIKIA